MLVIVGIFFAIAWSAAYGIARLVGGDLIVTPIVIAVVFAVVQYLLAPAIVKWTMGVRYVGRDEEPALHAMVEGSAAAAGIPKPKVGISEMGIPNAFAFGRWRGDGRVCVTRPLMDLLSPEELRAVVGHEIAHIRNRDVMIVTFLSVLPNIFYYIFRISLRMRGRNSPGPLIAIVAIAAYFLLQLLVLYVSRIREYGADEGAVRLGNQPSRLASALYKLVYGSARLEPQEIQSASGFKAFFASDPSRAADEIRSLQDVDVDRSGTIEPHELDRLRTGKVRYRTASRAVELLRTHPDMVKRIRRLADLQAAGTFRVRAPHVSSGQ